MRKSLILVILSAFALSVVGCSGEAPVAGTEPQTDKSKEIRGGVERKQMRPKID